MRAAVRAFTARLNRHPSEPWQCGTCDRIVPLKRTHLVHMDAGRAPHHRRRGCTGELWRATELASLRAAARQEADPS